MLARRRAAQRRAEAAAEGTAAFAATRLQSAWRGQCARQVYAVQLTALYEREEQEHAAAMLQSSWRFILGRRKAAGIDWASPKVMPERQFRSLHANGLRYVKVRPSLFETPPP